MIYRRLPIDNAIEILRGWALARLLECPGVPGINLHFPVACLCLIGLGLGGCATTNIQLAQAHLKTPIKILLMQVPMTIDAGRLQSVLAPDTKLPTVNADQQIARGVSHAETHVIAVFQSALSGEHDLILVVPASDDRQLVEEIANRGLGGVVTQDEADRLHADTGADAILRFGITDYGKTPRSWRNSYIAFEVTTTLAIAAVIAHSRSVAAKSVAGVYLVQEAIEETATGYAGFWALDKVCRPVRIEAEFLRLNPVAALWKSSDTGLSDVHLSRLFREVGANERNLQLDEATEHAGKDMVSDFADSLDTKRP
jgi:hypothetical protein